MKEQPEPILEGTPLFDLQNGETVLIEDIMIQRLKHMYTYKYLH